MQSLKKVHRPIHPGRQFPGRFKRLDTSGPSSELTQVIELRKRAFEPHLAQFEALGQTDTREKLEVWQPPEGATTIVAMMGVQVVVVGVYSPRIPDYEHPECYPEGAAHMSMLASDPRFRGPRGRLMAATIEGLALGEGKPAVALHTAPQILAKAATLYEALGYERVTLPSDDRHRGFTPTGYYYLLPGEVVPAAIDPESDVVHWLE